MKPFALRTILLAMLFAAFTTACKNNNAPEETPGENWQENHTETNVDTNEVTTDTIIDNSTQTDPAATN